MGKNGFEIIQELQGSIDKELSQGNSFFADDGSLKLSGNLYISEGEQITGIYLNNLCLKYIPSPLLSLVSLKSLIIRGCEIEDITPLAEFKYIQSLDLGYNQIKDIKILTQLINLQNLTLPGNQIQDITPLSQLTKLQSLDLSNIRFNQIEDISPLSKLVNLESLDLSKNQIKNIESLSQLINLRSLFLSSNQIQDITSLGQLKNLQILFIGGNEINDIKPLAQLKKLQKLILDNNKIEDITPLVKLSHLKNLDIKYNYIKDITPLVPLFSMQYEKPWPEGHFPFSGNPLGKPPMDIATQGMEAIRNFTEQMKAQGSEVVYEAKILLVGDPEAGKTTLMEKLFNPNYPVPKLDQEATVGIIIRPGRIFSHQKKPDIEMKGHIWDFGGQAIQYMLHQYFLTEESLYVLVTDERRGNNRFDYWFQIIRLLADKATVIVVRNKKTTETKVPFNRTQYQKDYPELEITDCEVDFKTNDYRWKYLIGTISRELQALPVMGQQVPRLWKSIRERIEKEKTRNYIQLNYFEQLCKETGLYDVEDILILLRYFHKIGIVLHFENEAPLANVIFLNPNWIVKALYSVLSGEYVQDNQGLFTKEWLFEHWKKKNYSMEECYLLLTLMLKNKFDLCYELTSKPEHYLVPLLLPENRPQYSWDNQDNLHFRYQYPFMPYGIISRLIVRLSHMIEDNYLWATGAIFLSKDVRAEVIQTKTREEGLKVIHIKVQGAKKHDKLSLLYKIRNEIDYIHENAFHNLPVTEKVACICTKCKGNGKFFEYKNLKYYIEINKETIECRSSGQDVQIEKLIGATYSDKVIKAKQGQLKLIPKYDLFVSYSKQDKEAAQTIVKELKQNDMRIWFDQDRIKPGDSIIRAISKGLADSDNYLFVLSVESLKSHWVKLELEAGVMLMTKEDKKRIILLLLEEVTIPELLTSFKTIDYSKDKTEGLTMLLNTLKE